MVKPETSVVAMSASTQWAVRGARGRHALKDVPGTWETRRGVMRGGRESEGFIVVLKRGNARGAKGPQRNMYLLMRGDPLGREFHYGKTGRRDAGRLA